MYHHVGPRSRGATPEFTVSPERFAAQIGWLGRNGYSTIRCTDWLAWCGEAKPLPERPVLISFDDAYADLAEAALPVLRHYRFTATIFVVTGLVGRTNQWDRAGGLRGLALMSARQIRDAAGEGIEFGCHSRTHPHLTELSSQQLEDEVAGSKADLEELLSGTPTAFAYPYGCYDDRVRDAVAKHFSIAFTVDGGINTVDVDPLTMRRVAVSGRHPPPGLNWLLRFGFGPVRRLRELVQLRTRLRQALGMLDPPCVR